MRDPAVVGKLRFECLHLMPERESACIDDALERSTEIVGDRGVLAPEVDQRNLRQSMDSRGCGD
jgi:hypothetical protein